MVDEGTLNLDVELERQINAAIQALNITRIVIAHRPDTIASCDRVIAMKDGRLQAEQVVQNAGIEEESVLVAS